MPDTPIPETLRAAVTRARYDHLFGTGAFDKLTDEQQYDFGSSESDAAVRAVLNWLAAQEPDVFKHGFSVFEEEQYNRLRATVAALRLENAEARLAENTIRKDYLTHLDQCSGLRARYEAAEKECHDLREYYLCAGCGSPKNTCHCWGERSP